MDALQHLRLRAERARRSNYTTPVVASVEEAHELARMVADQLAALAPPQRVLFLADLEDVCTVVQSRLGALESEIAETRRTFAAARAGSNACVQYAAAGRRRG
ncbi:hypothetical protein DJ021_07180 [Phenylobacterium hankyongense]|uniref:Uncharacterized protein n=1 Tax=Phenylobacterium hankyongense TaxID=1813876 RepID=A0A328AY71_9CAUL|nr:hypothetical protein [Phenylobacterium hankyongense]RAK59599.1 hypothetical protein DJ021_07180 [Phenylobacterium hankyongense]